MIIKYKKNYLYLDQFKLKCCIGKAGIKKKKEEGDKATPSGVYGLGNLYFRKDRIGSLKTNLKKIIINKNMGWCNDARSNQYNKMIKISKNSKFSYEKLFRNDYKYDLLIPILYNYLNTKKLKGSAIFIHLTKEFKPTVGCIGLCKRDFLILLKLINKNFKIKIIN